MIQEAFLQWRYHENEIIFPWYTLPTLKWLKTQSISNWNVFEYGGGYSTNWWRLNSRRVCSVDGSGIWAKTFNIFHEQNKDAYIKFIANTGSRNEDYEDYDCIIVDGEHREECVEFCIPYLKPGGFLIIDNYEETHGFDCRKINELLKDWAKVVYQQPNHSDWKTATFCKPI